MEKKLVYTTKSNVTLWVEQTEDSCRLDELIKSSHPRERDKADALLFAIHLFDGITLL